MTIRTLSRRPGQSHAEGSASFCASPVSLAEEGFLLDKCGSCFHESLDVGSADSLAVSVVALLFPSLLSIQSLGHKISYAVNRVTISIMLYS